MQDIRDNAIEEFIEEDRDSDETSTLWGLQ